MNSEIFKCDVCAKSCDTRGKLNRHLKTHSKPFRCESCSTGFALRLDLERHIKARHRVGNDQYRCGFDRCFFKSNRKDNLNRHIKRYHASTLLPAKNDATIANNSTTVSLSETLASPPAVNSSNGIGSVSMFMQAASSGDITTLELLMNSWFTTETTADDGSTALHCAARNGQSRTVQYLLRKGARTDSFNEKRRIPLYEAILSSDIDTVKILMEHLSGTNYRHRIWEHYRYLAQTKSIKIVELYAKFTKTEFGDLNVDRMFANAMKVRNDTLAVALLHYPNFDVNRYNRTYAPIHTAARYGNAKMMQVLLASDGIMKNLTIKSAGQNALHIAASNGHADIVEQLLNLNCDVDSLDERLHTPLQYAAMRGHLDVIELLVDKWKADISSSDRLGNTPLHHAAFNEHWKCVHVLLEYIDLKNHRDIGDIRLEDFEFVKKDTVTRLLNSAAFENPNIRYGDMRYTLLHYYAKKGDLEVLDLLLVYDKIDVNARTYGGEGPLGIAVRERQIEAVRLLLQHPQIDVNQKYRGEDTALSYARLWGFQEIADLLLSHDAVDDQAGNTSTSTLKDSSSLTTVETGHTPDTTLQSQHEIDSEFDFDAFMEGLPALDDISDAEDEMMGQEFS